MTKYHISDKGEPALCRAEKVACPKGANAIHFESNREARDYIESQNMERFDAFSGVSNKAREAVEELAKAKKEMAMLKSNRKANESAVAKKTEDLTRQAVLALSKQGMSRAELSERYNNRDRSYSERLGYSKALDELNHAEFLASDSIKNAQAKAQEEYGEYGKVAIFNNGRGPGRTPNDSEPVIEVDKEEMREILGHFGGGSLVQCDTDNEMTMSPFSHDDNYMMPYVATEERVYVEDYDPYAVEDAMKRLNFNKPVYDLTSSESNEVQASIVAEHVVNLARSKRYSGGKSDFIKWASSDPDAVNKLTKSIDVRQEPNDRYTEFNFTHLVINK